MKTLVISVVVMVLLVCMVGLASALELQPGERMFKKNGVTYIIGTPTPEQIAESDRAYTERWNEIKKQNQADTDYYRQLEIERIRATRRSII
jgi:hypothetical protein